jgi:hypothetical protein
MLRENYTLLIPILFAIIAVPVKLLSRREGDKSPKINDTCIGQSLLVGALSASLAFAVSAQKAWKDINKSINERAASISQAEDRIRSGKADIEDVAFSRQFRMQVIQASEKSNIVTVCLVLIAGCLLVVLFFAYLDRFHAFEEVKNPWLFHDTDLKNLTTLAAKLQNDQDPLAQYLRGKLSQDLQRRLAGYNSHDSSPVSKSLKHDVVNELNQLLAVPDLFNDQRFAQVSLTDEIRELLKPQGERVIHLNRALLEAAYPQEIAKNQVKDGSECKVFQRKFRFWAFVNLLGLVGFLAVLFLTK